MSDESQMIEIVDKLLGFLERNPNSIIWVLGSIAGYELIRHRLGFNRSDGDDHSDEDFKRMYDMIRLMRLAEMEISAGEVESKQSQRESEIADLKAVIAEMIKTIEDLKAK